MLRRKVLFSSVYVCAHRHAHTHKYGYNDIFIKQVPPPQLPKIKALPERWKNRYRN